jgi:ferredoxin
MDLGERNRADVEQLERRDVLRVIACGARWMCALCHASHCFAAVEKSNFGSMTERTDRDLADSHAGQRMWPTEC